MGKAERVLLWVLVVGLLVGWVVTALVLFDEIRTVNQRLLALANGRLPGLSEEPLDDPSVPAPPVDLGGQAPQVGIAGLEVYSDSVRLTVTVAAYGAGDLLFEGPVLATEEGQVLPVAADSLETARLAFLDLVTRGQATADLEFVGQLEPTAGLWLVLNPSHEATNVTAPPLQVPLPIEGLFADPVGTPEPTDDGWG